MSLRRFFPCLLVVAIAACADSPLGFEGTAPDSLKVLPRALSEDEQHTIASSNRFAFDLFRSINTRFTDTNVFISPLSASFALGMTLNGAEGETFDGMTQALRILETDRSRINAAYRDLIALLLELDPSVDMRIANAIWYRDGFPFHQSFLDTAAHYFDARVAGLNFDDPASVTRINAWADTATAGKIPEVLDAIDSDIVMLLMNAIYFTGSWRSQFDPDNTHNAPRDAGGRARDTQWRAGGRPSLRPRGVHDDGHPSSRGYRCRRVHRDAVPAALGRDHWGARSSKGGRLPPEIHHEVGGHAQRRSDLHGNGERVLRRLRRLHPHVPPRRSAVHRLRQAEHLRERERGGNRGRGGHDHRRRCDERSAVDPVRPAFCVRDS